MHEDGMRTRWMDLLLVSVDQLERLRAVRRDASIRPLMMGNGREIIDG